MAIINNSQNEEKAVEKTAGIISSSTSTALPQSPTVPSSPVESSGISFAWVKYFIIVVSLLLLASAAYIFVPKLVQSIDSNSVKPLISLEVKRMVRIGGLIDLLEKKIVQINNSLEQAKLIKDRVIIDTLRLQLSRSLHELDKHQEAFIAGLVNLHQFHQQEPKIVIQYFKEVLKDNKDAYKLGNAKTVGQIQGLIVSVKEDVVPEEFFRKSIKAS